MPEKNASLEQLKGHNEFVPFCTPVLTHIMPSIKGPIAFYKVQMMSGIFHFVEISGGVRSRLHKSETELMEVVKNWVAS